MTTYQTLRVLRDEDLGGLVTIVLDRHDSLNAIDRKMHEELQAVCL